MKFCNLIFFIKNKLKNKYNIFHSKYKFSQKEVFKIVNKVKFNIPDVNLGRFNKTILENAGIKLDKPIYVENYKNLNFNYAKNLFLAQKILPFHLIIFYNIKDKFEKYSLYLQDAKFFALNYVSKPLKEQIYNLNINFKCERNKILNFCNEEIVNRTKFNSQCFKNFELQSENEYTILNKTYYNGTYYFFKNKIKNNQNNYFLIKKILFFDNFNYFLLKKQNKQYKIINLQNNEEQNILCSQPIKQVKIYKTNNQNKFVLELLIQSSKDVNLYIGKENINITSQSLEVEIQQNLNKEFSYKLNSQNYSYNYFFNTYFPNQIIIENLNSAKMISDNLIFRCNKIEEIISAYKMKKITASIAYETIKNLIVENKDNILVFKSCGLKNFELKMFFEGQQKNINFRKADNIKKVVVDGFSYINCNAISKQVLKECRQVDVFL